MWITSAPVSTHDGDCDRRCEFDGMGWCKYDVLTHPGMWVMRVRSSDPEQTFFLGLIVITVILVSGIVWFPWLMCAYFQRCG